MLLGYLQGLLPIDGFQHRCERGLDERSHELPAVEEVQDCVRKAVLSQTREISTTGQKPN